MPRLVAPLLAIALAAVAWAGCGKSSSDETDAPPRAPVGASAKSCEAYAADAGSLRATGIPCDQARLLVYGWRREPSCELPRDASRGSCLTRSYRCQATRGDRGLAVSCARPGQSIAFIARQRDRRD